MIGYSPAKINIGLFITGKRTDGYHDLQSLMAPVPLTDIIDLVPGKESADKDELTMTGISVPGPAGSNLCLRAVSEFRKKIPAGPVRIHLHKRIPVGSGLGGGSSNAVTTLRLLNKLSGSPLEQDSLHELASRLGSDCPLFLHDVPVLARGRGEIIEHSPVRLTGLHLVLVRPEIHISTAEAYSRIQPDAKRPDLATLVGRPVETWKDHVSNDFEKHLFRIHPLLKEIKTSLYDHGAIYASMSGSGSAVFGLFRSAPARDEYAGQGVLWTGVL